MSDEDPKTEDGEKKKTEDGWSFWRVIGVILVGGATIVTGNIMLDKWRESSARRRRLAAELDEDLL